MFSIFLVTLLVLIACFKSSDAKKSKKHAGGIWKLKAVPREGNPGLQSYLTMDANNGKYQLSYSGTWSAYGASETVICQSGLFQIKNVVADVGQVVFYPEKRKDDYFDLKPTYFFPYSNNFLATQLHFSHDGLNMNLTSGVLNNVMISEWSKVESIPEVNQCRSVKFEKTIFKTSDEGDEPNLCFQYEGLCSEDSLIYVFGGPSGFTLTRNGWDTAINGERAYSYYINELGVTPINYRAMYPALPAGFDYAISNDGVETWFTDATQSALKTPSGKSLPFNGQSAAALDANNMFVMESSGIACINTITGSVKYRTNGDYGFFSGFSGSGNSITIDPSRSFVVLLTHTCTDVDCVTDDKADDKAECEVRCSYFPYGKRLDFFSVSDLAYVKSVDIPESIDGQQYFQIGPVFVNGNALAFAIDARDGGYSHYIEVSY